MFLKVWIFWHISSTTFQQKSLRKNSEDFKGLYKTLNLKFSTVWFSETWADDNKPENDSLIQLIGYNVLHQIRKNRRAERISIFVRESLSFKKQQDLDINQEAVESISIEILKLTNATKKLLQNLKKIFQEERIQTKRE